MNVEPIIVGRTPIPRRVKRNRWCATRRLTEHGWEVAYGRSRRRAIRNLVNHRQR